jgi:hypothetical protein
LGTITPSNAGSTVSTSGSEKNVVGWLKSRGGFEMTVGGVARCANTESPASAAPATAPIAFTIPRREIRCASIITYLKMRSAQSSMHNAQRVCLDIELWTSRIGHSRRKG